MTRGTVDVERVGLKEKANEGLMGFWGKFRPCGSQSPSQACMEGRE